MSGISEKLLNDIAARVVRRVASSAPQALPTKYVVLALSGEGAGLDAALARVTSSGAEIVAVADCPSGSAGALATVLARVPKAHAISGEAAYDADALLGGAERVLAPAMDLALASRVVAMQTDSPAARVVWRALLRGVPVEAWLDERAFAVSSRATEGARGAVADLISRLEALGVAVVRAKETYQPRAAAAAAGVAGRVDPSEERFSFPEPLNEFVEYLENRPCTIEAGKPCVACGACEARGF